MYLTITSNAILRDLSKELLIYFRKSPDEESQFNFFLSIDYREIQINIIYLNLIQEIYF